MSATALGLRELGTCHRQPADRIVRMQETLWDWLGISPLGAIAIVIATVVMYLLFVFVTRLGWQHLVGTRSAFSLALITVLGSVVARTMLGPTPTLATGIIVMTTLLLLESATVLLRRIGQVERLGRGNGTVVVAHGTILGEALRATRLTERDLLISLRQRGVTQLDDVAAAILESNGSFTVFREGVPIDPRLLAGVNGADELTNP